jgi:beta-lactamase regulating signal transducer with metallopeptidase domain
MNAVFIKLLNMSITASWLVLIVIILRFLLRKAPKWSIGILWGFVALRLIFPVSIESIFSIIPTAETIPQNIVISESPSINSGFEILNRTVNPIISDAFAPSAENSINPMQIITFTASIIWIIGIIIMCVYAVISFARLYEKVKEAVPLKDNIWLCDRISTPFIIGILRPRIYMPSSMDEEDMECVVFHEQAHIKRKDHIWKPLGFLLLSVYWFNPILWLAYFLFCKDIELACDEKVLREKGNKIKKHYSTALINCSVPRKTVSACPLAFGETGVKERVKSVLSYKKPAFWIVVLAVAACIITAVCLLTNPKSYDDSDLDNSLQVLLDTQIAEHHKSAKTKNNFIAIDYKIMKVDDSFSETSVYMWVLYTEYSSRNGELKQETAAHTPTVITAKKNISANKNGILSYELKEYWTPRDGSLYKSDIKKKFPIYLWDKALDSQRYIDEQNASCLKAAMKYYGISESKIKNADEPQNVYTSKDKVTIKFDGSNTKYELTGEDAEFIANFLENLNYKDSICKCMPDIYFSMSNGAEYGVSLSKDVSYARFNDSQTNLTGEQAAAIKNIIDKIEGNAFSAAMDNRCFDAEILQVNDKEILVKPDSDTNEIKSADKISVSLSGISVMPFAELKAGDNIRIVYDGTIAESYPAQINKAFAVYLLGEE